MIYAENIFICIVIPLLLSLLFVRGESRRFVVSLLCGMLACLLAAYISGFLSMTGGMSSEDAAIFLSPMVEEMLKFFPLLLYLLLMRPSDRELLIVGVGVGVGFATFENCCALLSGGASQISYVLVRGLSAGVMHIVSIATLTMGLILARRLRALSTAGILGALSLSVVFHGLYNLLVSEAGVTLWIGYAMPLASAVLLFILYRLLRDKPEVQ